MVVLASHMDEAFRESYATICRAKTILVDVYRVGQTSVILGWFATSRYPIVDGGSFVYIPLHCLQR